jgi:predicted RNase H-like HicB family nuclease
MNYKVVVHESEEGFSISCPGLPGCWSQGETEAEALTNITDCNGLILCFGEATSERANYNE